MNLTERQVVAIERIADALEAHLELATKAQDPDHISAEDVRGARRELLLVYADELGVTAWGDGLNIKIETASNRYVRNRCLEALAGDTLKDEEE